MSLASSSTTEEFVLGEKLTVNHSETGHTFYIGCDHSTPVATIQRLVEALSGVQLADQLLMCGKINLDPQQPLAHYKLPQANRELFLFNKASLHADSPRPPPEVIDVPNAVIPSPSSPLNDSRPLDGSSDPALKALASYERQFRYHYNYAQAINNCTKAKFEICARLLREQNVQERALDTVRGNLEHTFKRLQQRCVGFVKCFTRQHRVHAELLANFERDVERLRSLRLHPAIQSEGRKCLLDLVKVRDLRKWQEICLNSHRQFESKVSQLKMSFGELKRRVENVLSSMSSGNSKELEVFINDHQKLVNDQEIIMQSLRLVISLLPLFCH